MVSWLSFCLGLRWYGSKGNDTQKSKHVHQKARGIDILRNPKLNKGSAFTIRERQYLGIHGMVPPTVMDADLQVARVLMSYHSRATDLEKFIELVSLQDRNEKLFYKVLRENIEEMLPIVYTPTVGIACQKYGIIYKRPKGLYISYKDKGHIYDVICNWPELRVKAIVVTDGERILGLGDLGVYGMGIPVGKLTLCTALAGIDPSLCLPITLDVGTNNKDLLANKFYLGAKRERVTGKEYDAFIDEFMIAIRKRYGAFVLVQFEDFGAANAYRLLQKYRHNYCMFNDDIQGTAAVVLAGIYSSMRVKKTKLKDQKFLFLGAGTAAAGIAEMIALAMKHEGSTIEEAREKIWMIDIDGLLTTDRKKTLSEANKVFAKKFKPLKDLEEIVKEVRPTALIGASAVAGAFTTKVLKLMAEINERPIIFALSNPTSVSECTAEAAYTTTEGRCLFASGSPFPPCTVNGRTFQCSQGNNAYIFPGIVLGVIFCEVRHVEEIFFLRAARHLASLVSENDLSTGQLYPPLSQLQDLSLSIATDLAEYVYKEGKAAAYPEPKDKTQYLESLQYKNEYEMFEPKLWDWS